MDNNTKKTEGENYLAQLLAKVPEHQAQSWLIEYEVATSPLKHLFMWTNLTRELAGWWFAKKAIRNHKRYLKYINYKMQKKS